VWGVKGFFRSPNMKSLFEAVITILVICVIVTFMIVVGRSLGVIVGSTVAVDVSQTSQSYGVTA